MPELSGLAGPDRNAPGPARLRQHQAEARPALMSGVNEGQLPSLIRALSGGRARALCPAGRPAALWCGPAPPPPPLHGSGGAGPTRVRGPSRGAFFIPHPTRVPMEQALRALRRGAARVVLGAGGHGPTRDICPPWGCRPLGGGPGPSPGAQLPAVALQGAAEAGGDARGSPRTRVGPDPQSRRGAEGCEREPRGAAGAGQEGWRWPGGDIPKARRRLEGRPLPVERTRGSEILFGIAPCAMALSQSRRDVFRLFLKEGAGARRLVTSEFVLQAMARGVPVHHVRRRELDALCRGRVHQGVCLEASPLRFKSLEEAEEPDLGGEEGPNRQLVWLVLEQIQDPMNLGALLRSAYFLGVDRVVTSQRDRKIHPYSERDLLQTRWNCLLHSCPLTPTVSKASSGAMEVFDVYSTDDLRSFLKAKAAEGWEVVGTVSKPEEVENVPVISCLEFRWNKPIIIVIGNEGDGLSLETQLLCHRMLAIPPGRALHPGIESLNVSVATGILLHSICSQKLRQ
ncbi:rRNA methyltransferase 1, mitochondrial [Mergus octosetaceus]